MVCPEVIPLNGVHSIYFLNKNTGLPPVCVATRGPQDRGPNGALQRQLIDPEPGEVEFVGVSSTR
jgi:hypothetical protein